ncbi:MAG: helix-turn-helix domain-containing protein [Pedobacter sp.]|uniref:response regulator transcription factor n=1 Tax=Pedobacter sp. TaxID=1411316 RepID=UPI00339678DC
MYKTLSINAVTRLNYHQTEELQDDKRQLPELYNPAQFSHITNANPEPYALLQQLDKMFSKREKEVLLWMAEGLSSKMIADKLHISEHTVINHRRSMQEKSHKPNATALVSFAIRNGII